MMFNLIGHEFTGKVFLTVNHASAAVKMAAGLHWHITSKAGKICSRRL